MTEDEESHMLVFAIGPKMAKSTPVFTAMYWYNCGAMSQITNRFHRAPEMLKGRQEVISRILLML